jgi:hypothetical protein
VLVEPANMGQQFMQVETCTNVQDDTRLGDLLLVSPLAALCSVCHLGDVIVRSSYCFKRSSMAGRQHHERPQHFAQTPTVRPYVTNLTHPQQSQLLRDKNSKPEALVAPFDRWIIVVDIEGSTTRFDPAKARLRRLMYSLLEEALQASRIDRLYCTMEDRGDGALVLIRPPEDAPRTRLLDSFIPELRGQLVYHNDRHADRLRVRVALHIGGVLYDDRAPFGEAVDIACRLLDSPTLKQTLNNSKAPLVFVISDDIYRSIVRHGYPGIDKRSFVPLVRIMIANEIHWGWVYDDRRYKARP